MEQTFGQRIRKLRQDRGESLAQAAKDMNCTPQLISQYENELCRHANPKLKTIRAFAAHYGVTATFLIGDEN